MNEKKESKWYREEGEARDVAVSTRIRLARNISEIPFNDCMNDEHFGKVCEMVKSALKDFEGENVEIDPGNIADYKAMAMVERHLISREFAGAGNQRYLFYSPDESLSVMAGEEDHIRIQCTKGGLALQRAFEEASALDDWLDQRLNYAFDENLGYLTRCPTNLGTGMRASVMLHLPALTAAGVMEQALFSAQKLGLTVRGLYGEGTQAKGCFYQFSNQVTLGISEEETLQKLGSVVDRLIEQERVARKNLQTAGRLRMNDRIWRSYGLLATALLMSSEEFLSLIADVRLGVSLGILEKPTLASIDELILLAQPGNICESFQRMIALEERDEARANLIKKVITL